MTLDEMERVIAQLVAGQQRLDDNMTVQGVMMHRLENNFDRLEGIVEKLAVSVETLTVTVDTLAVKVDALADGYRILLGALKGLTETVDRFVRGQSTNGDRGEK